MLDTLLACELIDFSSFEFDPDDAIPLLAVGGGLLFMFFAMLFHGAKAIFMNRAREASRREIAAYIAEGSMTAEEGERLLNAGRSHWERWHC